MSTTALLEQAATALADVDWDSLTGTETLEAAVALGRVKALVDGALVGVAERLESSGAAEAAGWASAKDLLTHLTGGRKGAGATYLRIAKQTSELPSVRTALAAGEISMAQAGVIGTRTATLPRVPELREAAAQIMLAMITEWSYDATDLDHRFGEVITTIDPDGLLLGADKDKDYQERGAHIARFLSLTPDAVGGVVIRGYATIEEAELLKTTLMPLAAPLTSEPGACGGEPGASYSTGCPTPRCAHTGRDTREHGVRLWDALVEACRRLHATNQLPNAHATTARITVTMTLADLQNKLAGSIEGEGLLPSGDRLSATAVRRLACDAEIIPAVLGTQSQVLDVGRTNRLVTPGIWNALVIRDRHCAFPGCTRLPIACDAHHITHWADGGTTSLDNLLLLCGRHHTAIHQTTWTVTIDPHTRRPAWRPPPPLTPQRGTHHPPPAQPPLVA